MPDYKLLARIQHTIQHPIQPGHLDQFARFGPVFEMDEPIDTTDERSVRSADSPALAQSTVNQDATQSALTDPKRFILGGKAILTIVGQSVRYTFKVTRSDDQRAYFVSMLTGPENLTDYTYVGLLDVQTGKIKLTLKSKLTRDSQPVKAWDWTVSRVWAGQSIEPARIYHVGRCGRCGRALTVPSSIESGFGPECAGKLGE